LKSRSLKPSFRCGTNLDLLGLNNWIFILLEKPFDELFPNPEIEELKSIPFPSTSKMCRSRSFTFWWLFGETTFTFVSYLPFPIWHVGISHTSLVRCLRGFAWIRWSGASTPPPVMNGLTERSQPWFMTALTAPRRYSLEAETYCTRLELSEGYFDQFLKWRYDWKS